MSRRAGWADSTSRRSSDSSVDNGPDRSSRRLEGQRQIGVLNRALVGRDRILAGSSNTASLDLIIDSTTANRRLTKRVIDVAGDAVGGQTS